MEGGWDELFDESYLATYVPFLDEERTREAHGSPEREPLSIERRLWLLARAP
jgi:hypothetical protein